MSGSQEIDYSLLIAAEDFVPVVLTIVGVWKLADWMGQRDRRLLESGRVAVVALGLGGLGKAVWKLIRALDGPDIKPLAGALFPLLAVGFSTLAYAMFRHDRLERDRPEPQFWDGVEGNRLFKKQITDISSLGVATGAEACERALKLFGSKRIGIVTPYQPVGDKNVVKFFNELGFDVPKIKGLLSVCCLHRSCHRGAVASCDSRGQPARGRRHRAVRDQPQHGPPRR